MPIINILQYRKEESVGLLGNVKSKCKEDNLVVFLVKLLGNVVFNMK